MKLFQKAFLKELFLYFFTSLVLLIGITSTILTSLHMHRKIDTATWLLYLLAKLATFIPIFLPFSFLVGALFLIFKKRKNLEFLALFASGISPKRLLFPLLIFSSFISLSLILNDHFFLPKSEELISSIKPKLVSHKKRMDKEKIVVLNLDDHQVIYHDYDPDSKMLRDLFVVESPQKLWHFEKYSLERQTAYSVDLIEEKEEALTKTKSLLEKPFLLDPKLITYSQISIDKVNMKDLCTLFQKPFFQESKIRQIFLQINQKIHFFLFPFLLSFLIAPLLLKSFSRGFLLQGSILFFLFFLYYFFLYLISSLAKVGIASPYSFYAISFLYVLLSLKLGFPAQKSSTAQNT